MLTLGRYDILTVVTETSTTNIHKAQDKKTGEYVCVKVVSPEVENDQTICTVLRERFMLEAQVSSRLQHQNILRVESYFEHFGRPCLVCEFTDGDTVHRFLSQTMCFKVIDIVKIITHVLDALTAVHGCSIIHRDIKPGNIFLTPGKKIKLGGFGLAKVDYDPDGSFTNGLENLIVGTPNYMSPEQFPNHPKNRQLGITTDLYSTTMVLFEMLTSAMNQELNDDANIMRAYMLRDNNDLNVVALANYIPLEFARLISKGMNVQATDRYQTAAQLRVALLRANALYQDNLLSKKTRGIELEPINQHVEPVANAVDGDASASDTGEGNLALFDRAILIMLTKEAINYLRPATERLIKHLSKRVSSIGELINVVAARIPDTESRQQFIKDITPMTRDYLQGKLVDTDVLDSVSSPEAP